jgi:hypothetical protein
MYDRHSHNYAKLNACLFTVKGLVDMRSRSEMFKFYRVCSKVWTSMDNEFVKCRQLGRLTPRYSDLEAEFNAAVVEFEQWSLIAALTY